MTAVESESDTFEREDAAYCELLPKLVAKYGEQTVAIFGGEVVDVDSDNVELYRRVRRKFGKQFVLIRPISADYYAGETDPSRRFDLARLDWVS